MRILTLTSVFFSVLLFLSVPLFGTTPPSTPGDVIPARTLYEKIILLKVRDIQRMTGKKMTLKQKISFGVVKHKIKKKYKAESTKGESALIFGAVALALFIVGLFVPFVILVSIVAAILAIVLGTVAYKQNKSDKKALAGKLLGWITLGLTVALIIAAAIALSGWY